MRVLLQDAHTGLYCARDGAWVKELTEALDFPNVEAAAEHAFASERDDLNVAIIYETVEAQIVLNPSYCLRRSPPPLPPFS